MDDNTSTGSNTQGHAPSFLTVKDVQRELQVGERLVYKMIKTGRIPAVRLRGEGSVYRIPRREFEEIFAAMHRRPAEY